MFRLRAWARHVPDHSRGQAPLRRFDTTGAMNAPPVFASVYRGALVESAHRGDAAVVDEDGQLLAWSGNPTRKIFLRSAAKPIQAMPLLDSDGAERFRLSSSEIALMCASHSGEPRHVRVVRRLLDRGGFSPSNLVCGAQPPTDERSARALLRRRERPSRLHNNCSGKHAGLLLACRILELPSKGYGEAAHPLQQAIRGRLAELGSVPEGEMEVAIDGCGLSVFSAPLSALALAYARLVARRVTGETSRQRRTRRLILKSVAEEPEMVAGSGRFTTEFLRAGRGHWLGKEGAEGVYAIGLRADSGARRAVGIAFKIEDGSARARDAVALRLLAQIGRLTRAARHELDRFASPVVTNAAGDVVGSIDPEVPIIRRDAGQ